MEPSPTKIPLRLAALLRLLSELATMKPWFQPEAEGVEVEAELGSSERVRDSSLNRVHPMWPLGTNKPAQPTHRACFAASGVSGNGVGIHVFNLWLWVAG